MIGLIEKSGLSIIWFSPMKSGRNKSFLPLEYTNGGLHFSVINGLNELKLFL